MKYTLSDFSMDSPEEYDAAMEILKLTGEEALKLRDTPKQRLYLTEEDIVTLQSALSSYIGEREGAAGIDLKPYIRLGYMLEQIKMKLKLKNRNR